MSFIRAEPCHLRVGGAYAIISWPRRYPGPTWLELGAPGPDRLRPTRSAGRVAILENSDVRIEVTHGVLTPELEPALLEAGRNMVWAHG